MAVPAFEDLGAWRRGDTVSFTATITLNDLPLDLTGATVWATFKTDRHLDDEVAPGFQRSTTSTGVVITNALNGQIKVTIDPDNTVGLTEDTQFEYDIQFRLPTGRTGTPIEGVIFFGLDVTKAVA